MTVPAWEIGRLRCLQTDRVSGTDQVGLVIGPDWVIGPAPVTGLDPVIARDSFLGLAIDLELATGPGVLAIDLDVQGIGRASMTGAIG